MRMQIVLAMLVFATLAAGRSTQAQSMAPLPSGWPKQLELGMADSPGGAAAMKNTAPFAFRYQYLAGGVNTGNGWANWNTNGDFARFYIQDSAASGIIPVFTYYMLLQSAPGGGSESNADLTNLNNTATMTAYYNDLKLFFQKAGAFHGQLVVLHVEPDLWGYVEQASTNGDAATVAAKVSETGLTELAGLPSNVSGFARAVLKLRDAYAPNVVVAYHISVWGTGVDIAISNPPDATVDALAARAAAFYKSLGANFDLTFGEFSDRDSGFYQYVYGDGGQIVVGCRRLSPQRAIPRRLLDRHQQANRDVADPARRYADAIAEQHHRSLSGQPSRMAARRTGADASRRVPRCRSRGISFRRRRGRYDVRVRWPGRRRHQPGRVNGNSHVAASGSGTPSFNGTTLTTPYAADDDGGFFRWKAWQYYQAGAMTFSGALSAPTGLKITPPKH